MLTSNLQIEGLDYRTSELFDIHEYIPDIDDYTAFEIRGYTSEKDFGYLVFAIDINDRTGRYSCDKDECTKLFHLDDFDVLEKSCHSGRLWLCNLKDFNVRQCNAPHFFGEGRTIQDVFYPSKESMKYLYAIDPEDIIDKDDDHPRLFKVAKHIEETDTILDIPSGYDLLTYESFEDCENPEQIKQIHIHGNISLGDDAATPFDRLKNLESFIVEDTANLETIDGVLYLCDDEQAYIDDFCDMITNMNVKRGKVLLAVPQNFHVKDFIIPEGVVAVRHSAFFNCKNIESLTIPASVTEFGFAALGGMTNLKRVYVPNHKIDFPIDHYDELEPFSFSVYPLNLDEELNEDVRAQWKLISEICSGKELQPEEYRLLYHDDNKYDDEYDNTTFPY